MQRALQMIQSLKIWVEFSVKKGEKNKETKINFLLWLFGRLSTIFKLGLGMSIFLFLR